MTRIFDDPADFATDALDGFVAANEQYVTRVPGGVVRSSSTPQNQVALIVGGGSGHYPAFAGVVGKGIAAGAVCGNVFTSPSAAQAYSVARSAQRGGGVLFSYGNYAGDVIHFGQAQDRLRSEGIDTRTVLCTDDIASAPMAERSTRRGIAGDFVVFKIAGAAAERGFTLDEVERLARAANERTRTLGVAFAGCTLPGAANTLFTVPTGRMAVGLGIHGEPGISDEPVPSARQLAAMLVTRLMADLPDSPGTRVAVLLNGLGTVKYEELFVLYGQVARRLGARGITIVEPECGELVTSLDMAGLSLTLFWLDAELEPLWRDATDTPAFRKRRSMAGEQIPGETSRAQIEIHREPEIGQLTAGPASLRLAKSALELIEVALLTVTENCEELGRIDAIAGDGDHGTGMVRGLAAAAASARRSVTANQGVTQLLTGAGHSWSDQAGGTSGALWGAALAAAGECLGDRETYTGSAIADAVTSGVGAIRDLGHAQPGDKTMLDAMLPFAETLHEQLGSGATLLSALIRAARVAGDAATATAALRPKVGRARPLADKSVGHPDAGATSFALIVERLADAAPGAPTGATAAPETISKGDIS